MKAIYSEHPRLFGLAVEPAIALKFQQLWSNSVITLGTASLSIPYSIIFHFVSLRPFHNWLLVENVKAALEDIVGNPSDLRVKMLICTLSIKLWEPAENKTSKCWMIWQCVTTQCETAESNTVRHNKDFHTNTLTPRCERLKVWVCDVTLGPHSRAKCQWNQRIFTGCF